MLLRNVFCWGEREYRREQKLSGLLIDEREIFLFFPHVHPFTCYIKYIGVINLFDASSISHPSPFFSHRIPDILRYTCQFYSCKNAYRIFLLKLSVHKNAFLKNCPTVIIMLVFYTKVTEQQHESKLYLLDKQKYQIH